MGNKNSTPENNANEPKKNISITDHIKNLFKLGKKEDEPKNSETTVKTGGRTRKHGIKKRKSRSKKSRKR